MGGYCVAVGRRGCAPSAWRKRAIEGARADAGQGGGECELDEGGAVRESVLVDSGERGGEGQLGEPFAAEESASADACVGDGGEVDVGERGATEQNNASGQWW